MPKPQTLFECSKCGAQFPKWLGRCLECSGWGTLKKMVIYTPAPTEPTAEAAPLIDFNQVAGQNIKRLTTGFSEFDRVLGGGLVPGAVVLIGGDPGIGKSTLLLQVAAKLNSRVIYVSGEEDVDQIKLRLDRLKLKPVNLQFVAATEIQMIRATIVQTKPAVAIIDSIQTVYDNNLPASAGSIGQVRSCAGQLTEIAKSQKTAILIIGHVTKEGAVAGPKAMEHLVDTVLFLEGDSHHGFRLLRSIKNRFGPSNEIGVFDMQEKGLVEITDPSKVLLKNRSRKTAGSVITCVIEGTRPFLVEIQALVSRTAFGYPQRRSVGFDLNRLQLLTAVLIKRCNLPLQYYDIHLNVVGGLKITEPGADLAVATAIVSALKNKIMPPAIIFGEVGLAGEIRNVSREEVRLKEAQRLGFKKIIYPPKVNNLTQIVGLFNK